jgi:aspartate carbamoyltransferase catalytic subunit
MTSLLNQALERLTNRCRIAIKERIAQPTKPTLRANGVATLFAKESARTRFSPQKCFSWFSLLILLSKEAYF